MTLSLETLWEGIWPYGIAALVLGYLLGSIPFGVLVTRMAGLGDIRSIGSGNIGATNVLRTGNKWAALATLLGDGGKGAVAVLAARAIGGEMAALLAALGAFLGHLFPVWLQFKGGKGVATFLGLMLALHIPTGAIACGTWLAVAFITRYSSLSALIAAVIAPVVLYAFGHPAAASLAGILTLLVFVKHRPNIARLLAGTEPRIGKS